METLTDIIQLDDLDSLARVLLRDVQLDGTEAPGIATAMAIEAGRLTVEGAMLDDPAIRAVTITALRHTLTK